MTEKQEIVAWLKKQAELCDCHAYGAHECCCGAWEGNKSVKIADMIGAIEQGKHKRDADGGNE